MVFNPFRPILSAIQNNRDHRKITAIDGRIAYTGGMNLADEYINVYEVHGHWKDCALRVEGKAAWSLTLIFLELWQLCSNVKHIILISLFLLVVQAMYSPTQTVQWTMKMLASKCIFR